MKIFTKIEEIKPYLRQQQKEGKTIGLVPTMGYLHEGHLSLIRKSVEENDLTVVSIFVNPTQFGPGEDYECYPRNPEKDQQLVEQAGGQVVFYPTVNIMYPEGYKTYVAVEDLTGYLCGITRPGHFRGVATVVTKLFNIVHPERAYFGQKDAQQTVVIKRMVDDLNMDVDVKICPIVREKDGLALSSRNVYLNTEERKQAIVLSQSLAVAKEMILQGEKNAGLIKETIMGMISSKPLTCIDYVSIVNDKTLNDIKEIKGTILISLAVKFGRTRLIDNLMMEV